LVDALRRARLEAEVRAVIAAGPPDGRPQLEEVERRLWRLEQTGEDLEYGRGVWEDTEVGEAYRQMMRTRVDHYEARRLADDPNESFLSRRRWRRGAEHLGEVRDGAEARFEELVGHERKGLSARRRELEATKAELEAGIEPVRSGWASTPR
jgi:hypothetical protein